MADVEPVSDPEPEKEPPVEKDKPVNLPFESIKTTVQVPDPDKIMDTGEENYEPEQNEQPDQTEPARNEKISIEELGKKWAEFREMKIISGIDKQVNILNQQFTFENNVIKLMVTNPIQEDILEEFKPELMQFLRDSLKNDNIKLIVELIKEDAKKMVYTNAEKFKYLSEKNPHLKSLKEKMGLDPDF